MKRLLIVVVVGLMGAGCSNGPNSTYEEFGTRVNTSGFGHKYAQPEYEDELVLGPGDTISVQIANNPDLDSIQAVQIEGSIQVAYLGPVKVAGLTPSKVRDKLQLLLTPYIRDVSIVVTPVQIISKKIYVYTTDEKGGLRGRAFPLQGDLTLIDLITEVGGFNELSDDCHVKVVRGDPRHPTVWNINVRDMIENGYTAGNVPMRPDDIVFMQPTFFARIAQTLYKVTQPIRVLSQSVSDTAQSVFFLQNGTLPRNGGVY
ncbi:MAG: polysaccharide biosynthesis/export family protein [Planctomycetes bacterium]|nr:polysaccharide biosynthesis/export family protein [Planctomycetota bacterium]